MSNETQGCLLDGIEGYVYPSNQSQPAGTLAVVRMFNPTTLVLVLGSPADQATYAAQGFTNPTVIGYAYAN